MVLKKSPLHAEPYPAETMKTMSWDYDVQFRTRKKVQQKEKEQQKKLKKQRSYYSLYRAKAQIRLSDSQLAIARPVEARVFSRDYRKGILRLFSALPFGPGQTVSISIESNTKIYLQARIMGCHETPYSRKIMTSQLFPYRLSLQVSFSSREEFARIQDYFERFAKGDPATY